MTVYSTWPAWAARLLLLLGVGANSRGGFKHHVHLRISFTWGRPAMTAAIFSGRWLTAWPEAKITMPPRLRNSSAHFYPTALPVATAEPAPAQFSRSSENPAGTANGAVPAFGGRHDHDAGAVRPYHHSPIPAICGDAAQATGLAIAWHSLQVYQHEAWAALLMAIARALSAPSRYWPSVCIMVLACLVRELALPMI